MSSTAPRLPFDAIVITSASPNQAEAYTLELELRRRLGLIPESTLIVAVPDPAGLRVGSGGATLNALSVVSARLCYDAGYHSINEKFLATKRILILHSGGDSQRIPMFSVRGKAFSSLPSVDPSTQNINAPIDFLITKLCSIFTAAPVGGVVITATDVLLLMPDTYKWNPEHSEGITGVGIYANQEFGKGHGVYVVQPERMNDREIAHLPATNIVQKASIDELKSIGAIRNDGSIIIDSGIIYFSAAVTAVFLSLQNRPPLDSCTDTGLDGGNTPFRFELYTDIILVCNPALTREQYLNHPLPAKDSDPLRVERGRKLLWKLLRPFKFYVLASENSHFGHVGTTAEYLQILNNQSVFTQPMALKRSARSFAEYPSLIEDGVLINSILVGHGRVEQGALVENSYLRGNFHVERSSVVSGVRSISGLHTKSNMVVQEVQLSSSRVRADPRVRHLLSNQNERVSRDQPFFLAPRVNDTSKYADPSERNNNDPVLRVIVVYGVFDGIKDQFKSKKSTLCNRPWSHYFPPSVMSLDGRTSDPASPSPMNGQTEVSLHSFAHLLLDPNDDAIWDESIPDHSRTLWNARIYPVLVGEHVSESILWLQYPHVPSVQTLCEWKQATRVSLQDILALSDAPAEFYWRARASFLVDQKEMESTLLERKDRPLLPIIARCQPEYKSDLLNSLDSIASAGPLDVCARTLCTIADVLASLPGTHMHTRTGPARNPQWQPAIQAIASAKTVKEQAASVKLLAAMRSQWLKVGSSQLYMRAARHYDGAWASLTKKGVETVKLHNLKHSVRVTPVLIGQTVEATSPVRIDLMGGWSDTPPISFEHGGAVTNVAISIDNGHPIGASAKIFSLSVDSHKEKVIIIKTGKNRSLTADPQQAIKEEDVDDTVYLRTAADLQDYNDPTAPAALVKCVLLALGVVSLESTVPLSQQIAAALLPGSWSGDVAADCKSSGVGLYVRSWSNLPQGTGLGVSSILAADIVVAVAECFGQHYDLPSLMHLVLLVEQMLSTGGGWQDQVGGCYPSFKLGTSGDKLPLLVEVHPITPHRDLIQTFNQHVLLIHTGQSRLAKNLLGTVLRRWYQRDETITQVVDGLVRDSHVMRQAIEAGDIALIGRLFETYWSYKKTMASSPVTHLRQAKEPAVEPQHIQRLSARVRPHVHGLSLLGAGGGGFMCLITQQSVDIARPIVEAILVELNAERRIHESKPVAKSDGVAEEDEFHDDWPTGDYVLYRATVCEKGLTVNVS